MIDRSPSSKVSNALNAIPFSDLQNRLSELIKALAPGESVQIIQDGAVVGRFVRESIESFACEPGSAEGTDHWMAPDFDAPLDDFREYME